MQLWMRWHIRLSSLKVLEFKGELIHRHVFPMTDESGGKVLRGGGWSHPAEYVRLVLRPTHHPNDRYDTDRFRCVSGMLPAGCEFMSLETN